MWENQKGIDELLQYNRDLLDPNTDVGKVISQESIVESANRMRNAADDYVLRQSMGTMPSSKKYNK